MSLSINYRERTIREYCPANAGLIAGCASAVTGMFLYVYGPTWPCIGLADDASSFENTNNYFYCGKDGNDPSCLGIHACNVATLAAGSVVVGAAVYLIAKKYFTSRYQPIND